MLATSGGRDALDGGGDDGWIPPIIQMMSEEESCLRFKGSGCGVRLSGSGSGLCDPGQVDKTFGSLSFLCCKMGDNCSS